MTPSEFRAKYLVVDSQPADSDLSKMASSSPFYDQAETHTFSDWLLAYAFGVGVEDWDEYYLGGLPDLSEFIQKDQNSLKVDIAKIEELALKPRLLGRLFKKHLKGRWVIDLGCGMPEKSPVPRVLAQIFGATAYVGVDLFHVQDELRQNEFGNGKSFSSLFIQEDLRDFLKNLKLQEPKILFFSGVEWKNEAKEFEGHLDQETCRQELMDLIEGVLQPGDLFLLGAGSMELSPNKEGLRCIYSDPYQEIFRKKKFSWWPY